jgi:hypothetical protein
MAWSKETIMRDEAAQQMLFWHQSLEMVRDTSTMYAGSADG